MVSCCGSYPIEAREGTLSPSNEFINRDIQIPVTLTAYVRLSFIVKVVQNVACEQHIDLVRSDPLAFWSSQ